MQTVDKPFPNSLTGAAVEAYNLHANVEATIMHPFYEYTTVKDLYEGAGEAVVFGTMTPEEAAQKAGYKRAA